MRTRTTHHAARLRETSRMFSPNRRLTPTTEDVRARDCGGRARHACVVGRTRRTREVRCAHPRSRPAHATTTSCVARTSFRGVKHVGEVFGCSGRSGAHRVCFEDARETYSAASDACVLPRILGYLITTRLCNVYNGTVLRRFFVSCFRFARIQYPACSTSEA